MWRWQSMTWLAEGDIIDEGETTLGRTHPRTHARTHVVTRPFIPSVRPSSLAPRPVAHRPPPCHGRSRCDPGTSPPVPTLLDAVPGLGCVLSAIPRERRVKPPPLPSRPSGPPRQWGAAHPDQARQTTGRRPSFCRNRHLTWGQRAPCRGAPTDLRVTRRALASCATNCAAWHRRTEFPSLR